MQIELKSVISHIWALAAGAIVTLSIQWQDHPKTEVVCVPLPALHGHAFPANLAADATVVDAATADVPAPASADVTEVAK